MNALHGTDVFDLFDLENGDDIDFETAYKMISTFDDEMVLPKMNFVEFTEINSSGSLLPVENSSGTQTEESLQTVNHEVGKSSNKELKTWERNSPNQDFELSKIGLQPSAPTHAIHSSARPELLSTYESNAIEHFLDNLISQDEVTEGKMTSKISEKNDEISNFDSTTSPEERLPTIKPDLTAEGRSFDEYIAPPVHIPDITVADTDAPPHLSNDPKLLRKWKHVEVERLRRNKIKSTFKELIAMAKYPRGGSNKILKPSNDKRVPKHVLLSFIVDDIKSILQANHQLALLLEEAEKNTDQDKINGPSQQQY